MHRKSRGYKIHPEKSEKWIEDVVLHNPLPHLYNLQGERHLKMCSLREADIVNSVFVLDVRVKLTTSSLRPFDDAILS